MSDQFCLQKSYFKNSTYLILLNQTLDGGQYLDYVLVQSNNIKVNSILNYLNFIIKESSKTELFIIV